ncbi:serpin (serine protease inhibitor) [Haloactinopolyspora alba]|uniref:Serpin (Serine protease inhibitor) n=1 Tax=Haloactinopolyspora alba TaxID=648780 RepID=A0A2P8E7L5_9ACTN|nr:serpin family protein [Haloactinopolyspora alba]PSL05451.1 serpin (serine protease inhibitor) [Haloactinopolyspora alba]
METHASEVNELTSSWLAHTRGAGVLSGAGLWPLLAVLAASADEPGRAELGTAARLAPDAGMDAAREVLKVLDDLDGVDAALGLWAQEAARVSPRWRDRLPSGTYGELVGDAEVDQPALDRWANERTRGLIERFPVQTGPELMLTLATALTLRTTWTRAFTDERLTPSAGAWSGRRLAGLSRNTGELDDVRVATTAAGPVTVTRVAGENDIDVHLVLGGAGAGPGDVLPAALPVATGAHPSTHGSEVLGSGSGDPVSADTGDTGWPGLAVVAAERPGLALRTTRFTVRSEHDLLQLPRTFGLETVSRPDRGHFPEIGPVPLRVDQAKQAAVAIFSATGFEAAAVTAMGLRAVSAPSKRARGLAATYDRPFGFLAVHRTSGLVLFAGWVDDPAPWTPPEPRNARQGR